MTLHIFGNAITAHGIANNNRGETIGNRTTLPKIYWKDRLHVAVSAEAIRWAIRCYWQDELELDVNRVWDFSNNTVNWQDKNFDPDKFIDDDVMGYMLAKKGEDGDTRKRQGQLEVTRAVSIAPASQIQYTFNSSSGDKGKKLVNGKNLSDAEQKKADADNQKARTSLYSAEHLATRFQWGFGITPKHLLEPSRVIPLLDAVTKVSRVGGNHARFSYDFSPEVIVFRVTHYPAPQIHFCFETDDDNMVRCDRLVQLVEAGDIDPSELWIMGSAAFIPQGKELSRLGCNVNPSIRKGANELIDHLAAELGLTDYSDLFIA